MNNADLQPKLFLAAAAAMELVASKVGADPFSLEIWIALQSKIQDEVRLALEGVIPMEDAILHLNQISGEETAVGEPWFVYSPVCSIYPEGIEKFEF